MNAGCERVGPMAWASGFGASHPPSRRRPRQCSTGSCPTGRRSGARGALYQPVRARQWGGPV